MAYIVFQTLGGAGKNIMATAVLKSMRHAHPDHKIVVVASYPEVFLNNPNVHRVFRHGATPYFKEDYLKDDTIVMMQEPYHSDDFLHRRKHLVECWCDMLGFPCLTTIPELFLSSRELQMAVNLYKKGLPVLVVQTSGGAVNQNTPVSWGRDIPMQQAQAVVDALCKTHHIYHIRHEKQPALINCQAVTAPLRHLFGLIAVSDKQLLIDSFGQHAAAAFDLDSVVCWVANSHTSFGYESHDNVYPQGEPQFVHGVDKYLEDFEWTGNLQYECPYDVETMFDVNALVGKLGGE